jgi:F0F1-type ATP synthase assembly protein I
MNTYPSSLQIVLARPHPAGLLRHVGKWLAGSVVAAGLWWTPQVSFANGLSSKPIGEITMAIGAAELDRSAKSAGKLTTLQKGEAIREGDVIKTSANGHVHIKFIDGALVSVRPQSVLAIHEFKYDAANASNSVVRMSLERGEVRSVSGAAAQAAKDKFRLNTPLAAIGVKGTDFVTSASPDSTRVTVHQGAIVMAPFDQNCRSDTLGVCNSIRARELNAQMVGMALVYRNGFIDPMLQTAPREGLNQRQSPVEQRRVASIEPDKAETNTRSPEELLPQSRLVWGRWAGGPRPGDSLTVAYREAFKNGQVTVGDEYYVLFREIGGTNFLPQLSNQAEFKLTASSAQWTQGAASNSAIVGAAVDAASLKIDFSAQTFITQLSVSAPGLASQQLNYSGKVDVNEGLFLSGGIVEGKPGLAGALTLTGKQAGYVFTQPLGANGKLSGATSWSR